MERNVKEAVDTWKTFHKRKDADWSRDLTLISPFPTAWDLVGICKTTYYSSDKWQKDRSKFVRYYHDHDEYIRDGAKKTRIWVPRGASVPGLVTTHDGPPREIAAPISSAAVLGLALGFDVERPNGKKGKLKPEPGALLLSSPTSKHRRLYVLENVSETRDGKIRGKITALIWGPKLRVESRGVVH